MKHKPWRGAKWIWTTEEPPKANTYVYFRNWLRVPEKAQKIILRVTADSLYDLYVNEKFIIHGPVRSDPKYLYYDEINITPRLHSGDNLIAALVHYIGVGTGSYIPGPGGFICEVEITGNDKEKVVHPTPHGWIARKSQMFLGNTRRLNDSLGFSEYVDFSNDESGWYTKTFDESGFVRPSNLGCHPRKPYLHLTRRDIPVFEEKEEYPLKKYVAGKSYRYDFGYLVSGRVKIEFSSSCACDINVRYLEDKKSGQSYYEGHACMYMDRISIPSVGRYIWKSFEKRAFRYIYFDSSTVLENIRISISTYGYPVKNIGRFSCSDKVLNEIWEISSRTLKLCMDDQYNDCPQRERSQWMDAFAVAPAAFTMFGVVSLTKKFLLQYVQSQKPDGRLLAAYPSATTTVIPDYSLGYIIFLQWYLKMTGEVNFVGRLYNNALKTIHWFDRFQDKDGLIDNPDGLIYLDNTFDLSKQGKVAGLNAIYYGALQAMSEMAGVLGKKKESDAFIHKAGKVKHAFNRIFKHPEFENCFTDCAESSKFWNKKYLNINFSCEFDRWQGSGARARTFLFSQDVGVKNMGIGVYAGFRIWLNGKLLSDDDRMPSWERQPQYDIICLELDLKPGWNEVVTEVEFSTLNWDVYFVFQDKIPYISVEKRKSSKATFAIETINWKSRTKDRQGKTKIISARPWYAPKLSQTTSGYAALFGLCKSSESARRMLDICLQKEYYRNYRKVRVPFFCTESNSTDKLQEAVLPCNNPWSAYFFLSALFKYGMRQEAFEWIRMAWGGCLERGATTWWEEWGNHSSLCHAWGSYPAYFLQTEILGVKLDNLSNGEITVFPDLLNLAWVEGVVPLDESGTERISIRLVRKSAIVYVFAAVPKRFKIKFDFSRLKKSSDGIVVHKILQ